MEVSEANEGESPRTANKLFRLDSERVCRICFEIESKNNQLIEPCNCSGSMKFVHEDCMKKSILSKSKSFGSVSCEVCKTRIRMQVRFINKFSCNCVKEDIYKLGLFIILSGIITTIMSLIIAYLINSASDKNTLSAKVYLSIVLLACFCINLALIFLFYKTFKLACFNLSISDWYIFSAEKNENLDDTNVIDICGNKENIPEPKTEVQVEEMFVTCNNNIGIENDQRDRIDSYITEDCQLTPRLPGEVNNIKT